MEKSVSETYPALRYLLETPDRGLFPEERAELIAVLGRVTRLEEVNSIAEKLTEQPWWVKR